MTKVYTLNDSNKPRDRAMNTELASMQRWFKASGQPYMVG
jgi:hypothetical protein